MRISSSEGRRIRTVTTTGIFPKGCPAEYAIEALTWSGFDALDMALDYCIYESGSPFMTDGYRAWAERLGEKAAQAGIPFTHSHAPGGVDCPEYIERSVISAYALGARYLVVHPVYRDDERGNIDDAEEFIRINKEAYEPWIEHAEKHGIVILSENLQCGACSDPRNIARLVVETDSAYFGWCYDTGHANCFGYSPAVLSECRTVPLSLHIHDNDGNDDSHLIPGDGNIDWDMLVNVLADIGYTGDCVMEAHHQYQKARDTERPEILKRIVSSADHLRNKMEEKRFITEKCGKGK